MKFNEHFERSWEVRKTPLTLVYFLLKNDDVVYVGQTRQGLARPFSHIKKDFDRVIAIEVPAEQLDETESYYIQKYNPKLNKKIVGTETMWSYKRCRDKLRIATGNNKITQWDVKKAVVELGIEPAVVAQKLYILAKDYIRMKEYFMEDR